MPFAIPPLAAGFLLPYSQAYLSRLPSYNL